MDYEKAWKDLRAWVDKRVGLLEGSYETCGKSYLYNCFQYQMEKREAEED